MKTLYFVVDVATSFTIVEKLTIIPSNCAHI